MQQPLPELPARFAEKKSRILAQLSVPDSDYTDASPKGSVDEGIRELLDELNAAPGFVTTSSCAGRLSAFLEGRKTVGNGQVAGVGGKGAGGTWLYVSHEPVRAGDQALAAALTLAPTVEHPGEAGHAAADYRLIHLKFEPMVRTLLPHPCGAACPLPRHGADPLVSAKDPPRPHGISCTRPAAPAMRPPGWLP